MQGTGANINYEQIRDELNQQSIRSKSDLGSVSILNSTPNTTNTLDQFATFLQVVRANENQQDPNISNIVQSNFRSSRSSIGRRSNLKKSQDYDSTPSISNRSSSPRYL